MSIKIFGALLLVASTPAGAQRPITTDDYHLLKSVGDPAFSPDDRSVITITWVDQAQNRRFTAIWIAAADGASPPRPLTVAAVSSTGPSFSPDGRTIAFYSTRPVTGEDAASRRLSDQLDRRSHQPVHSRGHLRECRQLPLGRGHPGRGVRAQGRLRRRSLREVRSVLGPPDRRP